MRFVVKYAGEAFIAGSVGTAAQKNVFHGQTETHGMPVGMDPSL